MSSKITTFRLSALISDSSIHGLTQIDVHWRKFCEAADLGHSRAVKIPRANQILLQRSQRGDLGLRHNKQHIFSRRHRILDEVNQTILTLRPNLLFYKQMRWRWEYCYSGGSYQIFGGESHHLVQGECKAEIQREWVCFGNSSADNEEVAEGCQSGKYADGSQWHASKDIEKQVL